jgi:methionyl-tRNA synthetase
MSKPFYITTPIYYPNGEPHLGHVYTTVAADAIARYHRLMGDATYFLTGTDEHGIKMVKTAAAQNTEPRILADAMSKRFREVFGQFEISNDDFIRTSEDRHKKAVQKIVQQLLDKGDIYLGSYEGWYDEGQEEFVTETEAKNQGFKSAVNGKPLVRFSEKSYFFRLSKYVGRLLAHIDDFPEFVRPESRRNEVISKLKAGVEDLSISRASLKWGIPMPHDPEHVVYVWIDALSNYVTALGYGSDDDSKFKKFWPADVHLIGKEITWFHVVYWPAMLMSLGLPLPKCVFAHGWWTAGGKKMGKSTGNFIDLEKLNGLVSKYSLDNLRFYLLRAAPFGADLDWTDGDFDRSVNELADVLGNLLNRTLNMLNKYCGGVLPPACAVSQAEEAIDQHLIAQTRQLGPALKSTYEKLELQQCALLPLELARTANGYIDATKPFSLAKDPAQKARLYTVLHLSAQAVYTALAGLLPLLTHKAEQGLRQLGVDPEGKSLDVLLATNLSAGHKVLTGQPLFAKVEAKSASGG